MNAYKLCCGGLHVPAMPVGAGPVQRGYARPAVRGLVMMRISQLSQDDTTMKHTMPPLKQSDRDLGPYLLWDKALRFRAVFDARACNQVDLLAATQLLEQHALDTVMVAHSHGSRGQQLTTLTLTCSEQDSDQVAAALLQYTPATHISATSCEQCYLPQHTMHVSTPYGSIKVALSLAGSRVCKITPDWQQCEQAAAAAAAGGANGHGSMGKGSPGQVEVDAASVAAVAVKQLQAGLDDGSINLQTQYLF